MWRVDDIDEGLECPVYLMNQYSHYFTGWRMLERNALPRSGGWEEQACHWIQALEIIGGELSRWQREQLEKRRTKQN